MVGEHLGKRLTEAQRARWAALMCKAAQEAGLPTDAEFQSVFHSYIEWGPRLAVENSQSNARPPANMPMPRCGWDTAAGPPGSRVSALAAPADADEPTPPLPGPDESPSFAAHIKPLFRTRDRRSMRFAFDLWAYDDVRERASAILGRIRSGSMPYDGAWPAERIAVLERWVEAEHVGGGVVVEEAAAHEVAEHAALHGAREPLGVFGTEARGLVEAKRAVVSGREEAINDDDVEMEMRIQKAAEAVQERDGAQLGIDRCAGARAYEHGANGAQQDREHGAGEYGSRYRKGRRRFGSDSTHWRMGSGGSTSSFR